MTNDVIPSVARNLGVGRRDHRASHPPRSLATLGMTEIDMGRKTTTLTRMPRPTCRACHGFGSIRVTVHFHSGDHEWEAPCWECFGVDVKMQFPKPRTDNH